MHSRRLGNNMILVLLVSFYSLFQLLLYSTIFTMPFVRTQIVVVWKKEERELEGIIGQFVFEPA